MPSLTAILCAALLSAEPALAGAPDAPASPGRAMLEDHARRGMTFERLDGLAAQSAPACAAVCATREACQAWTWRMGWSGRAARCELHAIASTPAPHPGAVTGLGPQLRARIDAAAERPPSDRERTALGEAEGVIAPPRRDGLAGG